MTFQSVFVLCEGGVPVATFFHRDIAEKYAREKGITDFTITTTNLWVSAV